MPMTLRADSVKTVSIAFVLIFACALILAIQPSQEAHAASTKDTVKIKLTAVGDCALYSDYDAHGPASNFHDLFQQYGPNYFFRNVRSVFEKDDITLANLETTFTNATLKKSKTLNFKGPSSYAKILKNSSIEVVNIANNHSRDFLEKGFEDTKRTLKSNNIPYCFKTEIAYKKIKGVKIAVLGFNDREIETFTKKQVRSGIKRAKKKGAKIIIVNMHFGNEKRYLPSYRQKKMGRYAIDCGASVVIGHHPHVLQGVEKYKGRCIVYSLGNFVFGGNSNPLDKDTMIYQQTFTVRGGELTEKLDAKVIPCMVSENYHENTCSPIIMYGSEKKRIMSKIRALSLAIGKNVTRGGRIR